MSENDRKDGKPAAKVADMSSLEPRQPTTNTASFNAPHPVQSIDIASRTNAAKDTEESVLAEDPNPRFSIIEPHGLAITSSHYSPSPDRPTPQMSNRHAATAPPKQRWDRGNTRAIRPRPQETTTRDGILRHNPEPIPGPRAIHVEGPHFHLHRRASSDGESVESNPPVPSESQDFVVPNATLVDSIQLVEAVEEDTLCMGRMGRKGCLILVGVQLIIIVVVVVFVIALAGAGVDDGTSAPTVFKAPTNLPTQNPTAAPSSAPSVSPSGPPTEFPVPEECIFEIESIDPVIAIDDFAQIAPCSNQPTLLGLAYTATRCNETACSDSASTVCQDFYENGEIPDRVVVRRVGANDDRFLSRPQVYLIGSGSESIPVNNVIEIHRDVGAFNSTSILQRVEFQLTCEGQILCFRGIGAFSIMGYSDGQQPYQRCIQFINVEPVEFNFTISIQPKLPQGETIVRVSAVRVETNFTYPEVIQVDDLTEVVLTTSNRTVGFSLEMDENFDLWGSQVLYVGVMVNGLTSSLELLCTGYEDFYIPFDAGSAPVISSVCPFS